MDPGRIHAYLQAACAGLGFDVGEVWFSSSETGTSTVAAIESRNNGNDRTVDPQRQREMKFLQLYTSKSYRNRRQDLLRPESGTSQKNLRTPQSDRSNGRSEREENTLSKHVLSPKLVNAIANTAQVVWANCQEREGLLGRSDMRLQTAVGMPVAMDSEGNMCVVVMFSPKNVQSTTDAVEYLKSLSQGATSTSIPCLLPVIDSQAKRLEYNPKSFSDWEKDEIETEKNQSSRLALASAGNRQITNGDITRIGLDRDQNKKEFQLEDLPSDIFGIPMLPSFAELEPTADGQRSGNSTPSTEDAATANAFDQASYGLWSTIMQNPEISNVIEQIPDNAISEAANAQLPMISTSQPVLHPERKERLGDFGRAFLAMSVFDIADVWIPPKNSVADQNTHLHHAFSMLSDDTNSSLIYFTTSSGHTTIKGWDGAVGRAFCSGNAVWSANTETIVDTGRIEAFAIANIRTALAIPIFTSGNVTPSCVLCCYSLVQCDCVPFVLKFVQQALRTLWLGLENVEPHESIGRDLWKDVAPADLGEMAADLEMQKAFYRKKRPFESISNPIQAHQNPLSQHQPQQQQQQQYNNETPNRRKDRERSSSLALQMQSLTAGNTAVPLNHNQQLQQQHQQQHLQQQHLQQHQLINTQSQQVTYVQAQDILDGNKAKLAIQDHIQNAVQSVAIAQPISDLGHISKRAHIAPNPTNVVPPTFQQTQISQISPNFDAQAFVKSINRNAVNEVPLAPVNVQSGNNYNTATQINPSTQPFLQMSQLHPQHVLSQSLPLALSQSVLPLVPDQSTISSSLCLPVGSAPIPSLQQHVPMHPGVKVCRIQGCEQAAVSRRPYCTKHSGNRLCEHSGCKKCAQGATRFCISHGGGRRCTFPGCDKGARDKFFCAAHGGGKRCTAEGCKKSAVGGSNLCTSHGGGRRCAVETCQKSAQSSTNYCVKHGGGKKCANESCEKVARGRTLYCAGHGGGVRCKLEGCSRIAIGKMQLCRAHGGGSSRRKVA